MKRKSKIRIGNASGYWGDDPEALFRQVHGKVPLDYITMDFLAEITMSIMQKQRSRDPSVGYARDIINFLEPNLKKMLSDGTKLITNAGGINPQACAKAISDMAAKSGLKPKIAVVYGDDILSEVPALIKSGHEFRNMESGQPLHSLNRKMLASNVYFGARPVAKALALWNPDIVITGRVTDTGITLAAMIHEFQWSFDDFDKLASGIIAGHLIECGSQVTGGNFTDWQKVPTYKKIGYPIVEVEESGEFVLTKHEGTGGLVTEDTVKEQLVYEMGDPRAYITPDVVADFSTVKLSSDGMDRVKITGVKGYPATPYFKVSMAYEDGFKCIGEIAISGPKARAKAEAFAEIFWSRTRELGEYKVTETELFGLNACHKGLSGVEEANEVILRLGALDDSEKKLKQFSKNVPSLILGGPPGVAVLGGAPRVQQIVSYWPALIPKNAVIPRVGLLSEAGLVETGEVPEPMVASTTSRTPRPSDVQVSSRKAGEPLKSTIDRIKGLPLKPREGEGRTLALELICLARSGDKGDSANIGLLARSSEAFEFIKEHLTAQTVKDLFQEFCLGQVHRYEIPSILGLNFILENSLGGGGTVTLRADAQGKTLAQALLRTQWWLPQNVVDSVKW